MVQRAKLTSGIHERFSLLYRPTAVSVKTVTRQNPTEGLLTKKKELKYSTEIPTSRGRQKTWHRSSSWNLSCNSTNFSRNYWGTWLLFWGGVWDICWQWLQQFSQRRIYGLWVLDQTGCKNCHIWWGQLRLWEKRNQTDVFESCCSRKNEVGGVLLK